MYLRSFYFILVTLATVGYGDIYPTNEVEKILMIAWILIVMFFMTFNISSMTSMISSIDTKDSILRYKFSVVDDFCKESNLSKEFRERLKEALKFSTENTGGSMYNKQNLILKLPKKLRYEVSMIMHKGHAKDIFFFRNQDSVFVSNVVPLLISQRFKAKSVIYKEKDHPDEVYFIIKGRVGFGFSEKLVVFYHKTKGKHFGNIEVFLNSPRIFSTLAMVNTEVLMIKKNALQEVLSRFPLINNQMIEDAEREKTICLKHIFEVKAIFELKKNQMIQTMTNDNIRKYIERKFEEHDKI